MWSKWTREKCEIVLLFRKGGGGLSLDLKTGLRSSQRLKAHILLNAYLSIAPSSCFHDWKSEPHTRTRARIQQNVASRRISFIRRAIWLVQKRNFKCEKVRSTVTWLHVDYFGPCRARSSTIMEWRSSPVFLPLFLCLFLYLRYLARIFCSLIDGARLLLRYFKN